MIQLCDRFVWLSAHHRDHDGNDEYQKKFDSILSDLSNNETSEVLNAVNEQELTAKFGTPVRQEQNYFRAED